MFGSDFIHIKDHRGYEACFWWSDILSVTGVYPGNDEEDWVNVIFRSDRQPNLHAMMSMTEFLEEVEKQLNPQDTRRHTPNPYNFPPPPPAEFFKPHTTTGTVTPMSTIDSSGVPVKQIET